MPFAVLSLGCVCFQRPKRCLWRGYKLVIGNNCSTTAEPDRLRASQDVLLSQTGHLFLKVHDPLKSRVTVVKLERTQERLLLEGLNLELNEIIDLPPEGKKQLLSHREHALQSSSLVTQLGRDLYCGSRPPAKQPDSQTRVAKL